LLFALLLREQRRKEQLLGELLAGISLRMGPCFVKVAQMLSYRSDIFGREFLKPLSSLQDDVRYFGRDVDVGNCLADVERLLPESRIDPEPIGAGSVALVFKAVLADGRCVAVKVIRGWVPAVIRADISLLRFVVRHLARRRRCRAIPLLEIFDSVACMIERQVDMVAEAHRLDEFNSGSQAPIQWPARITEIQLHQRVLIMDYASERAWHTATLNDSDFRYVALSLIRSLYKMIFITGLVHCDLHPGNVLSDGGKRLILLDAGLSEKLSDRDRHVFRMFFSAFVQGDAHRCATSIVQSAITRPDSVDMAVLRSDVARVLQNYSGRLAGEFLVVEFVREIFEIQRRHRLYGAPGFVAAIWALVMYEGLVRQRFPALDFQGEAYPFVVSVWIDEATRYSGIR
jgi:ubiquinone biosynthesis protein